MTERKPDRQRAAIGDAEAFLLLVENVKDYAIFLLDSEGRVKTWNVGAQRIKGYTAQEIVGKHFSVFYPKEDAASGKPSAELAAAVREGRFEDEGWRVRKDGSRFRANVVITALHDAPGKLVGFVKITRDVTAKSTAEQLFRIAVEAAPNALLMVGRDGRIVFTNAQAEKLFGYPRQELIGQLVEKLVPERFRARHPVMREGFFHDPKARPMGAGRDLFGLRKDGTEVPVEIGLNPVQTDDGPLVLASIVDITERKRSEEMFQAAVESAPNAMIMVDREGAVVLMNAQAEQLFGYSREELIGQHIEVLVPKRFRGEHPGLRGGFFHDPKTRAMGAGRDLFGARKDGTEIPVEIGLNPVRTAQGLFVLASIVDISERKRAEAEIKRINAELEEKVETRTRSLQSALNDMEEFSYTVSHDLRAPLRALEGYARMIELKMRELPAEAKDYLARIRESAMRMDRLTRDVLTFSRVPRLAAEKTKVALDPIVSAVADQIRAAGGETEIVVRRPLPEVLGQESLVAQCVSNLVTNAIRYVPAARKPRIEIWAERHGESVRVSVRDNGVGIEPDHRERVFKPFVRLAETSDESAGTGIGLAIVKKAVERMGGSVGLDSVVGQGSTFWFELHGA